jgi:hypothetical protein
MLGGKASAKHRGHVWTNWDRWRSLSLVMVRIDMKLRAQRHAPD